MAKEMTAPDVIARGEGITVTGTGWKEGDEYEIEFNRLPEHVTVGSSGDFEYTTQFTFDNAGYEYVRVLDNKGKEIFRQDFKVVL